jgi:hypothetical protein
MKRSKAMQDCARKVSVSVFAIGVAVQAALAFQTVWSPAENIDSRSVYVRLSDDDAALDSRTHTAARGLHDAEVNTHYNPGTFIVLR